MSNEKTYLTKRTNGFYYIGYFDNGRLRWKTTGQKTKTEALMFLKSFHPRVEVTKTEPTLSKFLEMFAQLHGNAIRTRTLEGYKKDTKEFIRLLGDKFISQYNSQDIESYKSSLLANGLAISTVNIRYRSVKSVFGFALRHDYIPKSPFRNTSLIRMAQKTPLFLSKDDLQKLFDTVDHALLKDVFVFGALTGMRVSEIVNLKWKAIDFKQSQIVVGNDDEFTTKSGRVRVVPIHSKVLDILKRRDARKAASEYVFAKKSGYKLTESYVSHRFKFYVTKAKLDSRFHFHSLRHTTASHLVNARVSIYEVQMILGHSSVSTTMIYSHLAQSTLSDSINKIQL